MSLADYETALADVMVITMSITISLCALVYTFLCNKQYGRTAQIRKLAFRCVAATLMRPNAVFRIGVALVAIGFVFVAYYRWNGERSPEPVRIVLSGGMFLTVCASAGLAVARMVTNHWHVLIAAFSAVDGGPLPEDYAHEAVREPPLAERVPASGPPFAPLEG